MEAAEESLLPGDILKKSTLLCRCVPHQELLTAMTQAWGSACAGDNSRVECVGPSAHKDRDISCSSAALRVSHRSLPLKALEARYGVLRPKPALSQSVTNCLQRWTVWGMTVHGPRGHTVHSSHHATSYPTYNIPRQEKRPFWQFHFLS